MRRDGCSVWSCGCVYSRRLRPISKAQRKLPARSRTSRARFCPAYVTVTNEDTGAFRSSFLTADGKGFASQIVPGRYRLSAKLEGFRARAPRALSLPARPRSVDITPRSVCSRRSPSRRLSAGGPVVGGDRRPHLGAGAAELPAGNRSYGVCRQRAGAQFVPTTGFLNDTMLANGQPAAANNVTFDGAGNVDDLRGSNVGGQARTANEAIQEVQVLTNQHDAEFGRASGAVINAVTKSGTNNFGPRHSISSPARTTAKDYFAEQSGAEKPDVKKSEWAQWSVDRSSGTSCTFSQA